MNAASLASLPDEQLLETVQRQTFNFFWDGAHPVSGLAPDRCTTRSSAADDKVAIGGSGFGVMAIIVAVERGWVTREAALERLGRMLGLAAAPSLPLASLPFWTVTLSRSNVMLPPSAFRLRAPSAR